ncbi:succinylglutamate desuccinylase/aspartoacylase family protein [Leptolyngbya sp. AN02str]|uniref:succinylglutamate desuccinylase/aspartoacylase family protein n=1 Tax=Leptolyngbya sp. AN02str TaxID=3423363 RepID=UPI003D3170CB
MIPKIETIPLQTLASGDRLSLQIYKFVGAHPGKKAYIQANLHGAELAGNAVAYELMQALSALEPTQLAGEIWLVPVCNPIGVNGRSHHFSSGRYNPYDGYDWNRIFWDYEMEVGEILAFAKARLHHPPAEIQHAFRHQIQTAFAALETEITGDMGAPFREKYRYLLQSFAIDADYVIDLHTSSDLGVPYVYFFRDRQASALLFQLELGILLDQYDGNAFDESFIKPWLALESAYATLGCPLRFEVEAWTFEIGSAMQLNAEAIAQARQGIWNYFTAKQMIRQSGCEQSGHKLPSHPMRLISREQMHRYYAPTGGFVQSRLQLGDRVQPQQVIYQLLVFNKDGEMPQVVEVRSQHSGFVFDTSINHSVNEGEYVLGIVEDDR